MSSPMASRFTTIAQMEISRWRDGKVVHISDAGHNTRRERYETYIETVTTFLQQG